MSSIRKLRHGRYQADYQDKFRNIARTKRTFESRKEADDWLDAVRRDATARLLGHQRRRLFGEALAKYLREESPRKASHRDDVGNIRALRWPIWDTDGRRWLRLEDTPLEDVPAVLEKWSADLRDVQQRVYVGNRIYHRRLAGEWTWQPNPEAGDKPQPRAPVRDPALLALLNRTPGRGPFSSGTLRARQHLVRRLLFVAWKHWSTSGDIWLEVNIAEKIRLDAKSLPRESWLDNYDQLLALVIAAPIGFDAAILAAAWVGWRRSNLLLLEWPRVVFPVYEVQADSNRTEIQPGYLWTPRKHVKHQKRPVVYPLVPHIEQLFQLLWENRTTWGEHHYVFHRGDGRPYTEIKRLWKSAKRRAGIAAGFRWHDLRHTWVSWLLAGGAHHKQIAELGGWANTQMVDQVYGHLHTEHLRAAAQMSKRVN